MSTLFLVLDFWTVLACLCSLTSDPATARSAMFGACDITNQDETDEKCSSLFEQVVPSILVLSLTQDLSLILWDAQAFLGARNTSCTTQDDLDEGLAGTGIYPTEICATIAYHGIVGLCLASGPLGPLVGMQWLRPSRDEITDEELLARRPHHITQAAQIMRLRCLASRLSKTPEHTGAKGISPPCKMPCTGAQCALQEAERCAVCQEDFPSKHIALACLKCDSGFHVRCLNKWLLRAETCPCCRTKVTAHSPFVSPPDAPAA